MVIMHQNTIKDLTQLLPERSLHLSAVHVHRSGVKELSGPTKGATEAACAAQSLKGTTRTKKG